MPTTVALAAPAVHLQAAAGLPAGVELGPTLAILGSIFMVTLALRGLPFAALRFFRESDLVAWLGLAMPVGVMTLLVVYTVSGQADAPGGFAAVAIALTFTVALHLWRRSATLSILLGTVLYLSLIHI